MEADDLLYLTKTGLTVAGIVAGDEFEEGS